MKKGELLRLFYELRHASTGQPIPKRIKPTTAAALDHYIGWARKNCVNAEAFMRCQFEVNKILRQGTCMTGLASKKRLKMWRQGARAHA